MTIDSSVEIASTQFFRLIMKGIRSSSFVARNLDKQKRGQLINEPCVTKFRRGAIMYECSLV